MKLLRYVVVLCHLLLSTGLIRYMQSQMDSINSKVEKSMAQIGAKLASRKIMSKPKGPLSLSNSTSILYKMW